MTTEPCGERQQRCPFIPLRIWASKFCWLLILISASTDGFKVKFSNLFIGHQSGLNNHANLQSEQLYDQTCYFCAGTLNIGTRPSPFHTLCLIDFSQERRTWDSHSRRRLGDRRGELGIQDFLAACQAEIKQEREGDTTLQPGPVKIGWLLEKQHFR